MKKILSFLLCLATVLSAMIIPSFAADELDARDLESKGQQQIYLGNEWIKTPPVIDGVISEGEYQTSAEAKFAKVTNLGGAAHHFAYDENYIYIAVELKNDRAYKDGLCGYQVNLAFPTSGGFSDYYSRLYFDISSDESGKMRVTHAGFFDQYSGKHIYSLRVDASVVSQVVRGRDVKTYTTVYEMAIDKAKLQWEIGAVMTDKVIFFTRLTNTIGSYEYRFEMDAATRKAIEKTYPEHSNPKDTWTGHVINFTNKEEKNEKVVVADSAALKKLSENSFALRFKAEIDKEFLDAAIAEKGADKVKVGVLVAERDVLLRSGGKLTIETVDEFDDELFAKNIVSAANAPYGTDGEDYLFTGTIRELSDKRKEYYALAYVNVDGEITYASDLTERTVAGVAYAALRDLSMTKMDGYTNTVGFANNQETTSTKYATSKIYTPYPEAQIEDFYNMAAGFNLSLLPHFREIVEKKEGDLRVASSNVYFHHFRVVYKNGTEAEKQAAVDAHVKSMLSINADVLCLQEVSDGIYHEYDYKYQTRLDPKMKAAGYTKVDAPVGSLPAGSSSSNFKGVNYTPIWYRADVVTLEACEHVYYTSVGNNPDGGLSSSKSFTWALFTEKATGKQFIAVSTHMTWAGDAVMSNILRKLDASEVMIKVSELEKKYNVPVMVMGDFNSDPVSEPYKVMLSGNLVNAKTIAGDVINGAYATYHTFPTLSNSTAGRYMPLIGMAIDHVFVSKEGLDIKNYQTLLNDDIIASTDHVPVSIDFTIN